MEKMITYFGQQAKVACDEKCNKAWGSNSRPRIENPNNEDDYVFFADSELGEAPIDPGTYEGGHAKPQAENEKMNKWCVRECERCKMSKPGEYNKPIKLPDFSKRVYNIQRGGEKN